MTASKCFPQARVAAFSACRVGIPVGGRRPDKWPRWDDGDGHRRRGAMNPARLLAASAVVGLWAFSASAADCAAGGCGKSHRGNGDRLRRGRVRPIRGARAVAADTIGSREVYPHSVFTAVIYGDHRSKFGTPETSLRGKRICVTGQISDYHGKPEIILTDPGQLSQ